jgi:hypothetical protein
MRITVGLAAGALVLAGCGDPDMGDAYADAVDDCDGA